ncbi:MAG TPA: polymer-forming cytoskeletal protein [Terriglobales bacterium]|jgi:cytoskeletal protein CcmA (bactofilin family)|nr:polymer-forming cytoskeletal protein [Terriglobales bacterium]
MWSPSRTTSHPPQAPEPQAAPVPRNVAPASQERLSSDGSTYIGKSLVIKGELSGSEPIHIDGHFEGPISLRDCHMSIGRDAVVKSNVHAGDVIVRGSLQGNLTVTDRVEVHSGGSLMGDVTAGRISIEYGAYYQGKVDMRGPDPKAHIESRRAEAKPNGIEESRSAAALATY